MSKAILMKHEADPRETIYKAIAPFMVTVKKVMMARVLLAVYKRPEKTKGGVFLTDRERDEDGYQGKVGLIVGMGPLAFQDDKERGIVWGADKPQVGDWVMCSIGDTRKFKLGDHDMRYVEDVNIHAILTQPDAVW